MRALSAVVLRAVHVGDGDEGGDGHPGQPWTPPEEPPSPDGTTPPGDGTHRK